MALRMQKFNNMEIRSRKYIDIHYTESEQKEVDKIGKRLKRRGYVLVANDASGSEKYDYCDQYLGCEKEKTVNEKQNL